LAERQVVDVNAQAVAEVRLAHRADIRRARGVSNALLAELNAQAKRVDADKSMDGAAKRQRLMEIDRRRNEMARRAMVS
jgi:hypothetical protein